MYVKRWIRRYRGEFRIITSLLVLLLMFNIYQLLRNQFYNSENGTTLSTNTKKDITDFPSQMPEATLTVPTIYQINIYINNTSPIYNQIYSTNLTQIPTLVPTTNQETYPTSTLFPTLIPTLTPIPTEKLIVNSYSAKYYNNINFQGDPVIVRIDPNINFEWGLSSPHLNIQKDNFSARWEGILNTTKGTYVITTKHDDGLKIFIDNVLIHDHWTNLNYKDETFEVSLEEGDHILRIDYFDNLYNASVYFDIKKK